MYTHLTDTYNLHMSKQSSSFTKKQKLSVYLDAQNIEYVTARVIEKDFRSPSDCIRDIITKHRMGEDPALQNTEEKLNATMQQINKRQSRDLRRLQLTCDALDSMLQVMVKMLLVNVPEPTADVKQALRATADARYKTLLKLAHKHYEQVIDERKELEGSPE
jgi:hypothetical protein